MFFGLSLRNTSKAISRFVKRSHSAIRKWVQKYKPERLFYNNTKTSEFIIDETQLKIGSEIIWLGVAIELESKEILGINISKEKNMFVAERFLLDVIKECEKEPCFNIWRYLVSSGLQVLKIDHHISFFF